MARYADHDPDILLRAARYAQLPDIRRAVACAHFGLSAGTLRRAIKELGLRGRPRLVDYVLHAVTHGGTLREGPLTDLDGLANYLDYVNKDGSRAEDVWRHLRQLEREGMVAISEGRFRLLGEFP
ncbi:MAG: hypothetical protein R3B40_16460 [Polyangiales bacterium]|nr:hypothetical protein [Myxococcales bacterium]MCB9659617.1 hypothetical protein [Sandaracinaceae bacterium]